MNFCIDGDNNITLYADPAKAIAAAGECFGSHRELVALAEDWPIARLVEIWNSFAGVAPFGDLKPVKKFENRTKACARIWKACEVLAAQEPQAAPESEDKAQPFPGGFIGNAGTPAFNPANTEYVERGNAGVFAPADTAPLKGTRAPKAERSKAGGAKAGPGKATRKAATERPQNKAKAPKAASSIRDLLDESRADADAGTNKKDMVIAMMKRKRGATLSEVMQATGWQKHTVRGFVAGALKKAGFSVLSTKPEGGDRTYTIVGG